MYVKVINSYRYVVAICDENLIGKRFEQEDSQLDIKENFYKGEKMSEQETIELIKKMVIEDATFNIVGKESTQAAIKAGIISKENILIISEIPYSMILL